MSLLNIVFISPSESPKAIALPFPINGNFPTFILILFSFAFFSVKPMEATCGLQYVQPGIEDLSSGDKSVLPAIFSTHKIPSWLALCANQGPAVTSPIA